MKLKKLRLDEIKIDGGTQSRAKLNEDAVRDYAELYRGGKADMPRLVVYHDGKTYWLSEGFHRYAAAKLAGLASLECEVEEGGREEALANSLGSNDKHGVRRTYEDKRHAVDIAWKTWPGYSARKVAQVCNVSADLAVSRKPKSDRASVGSDRCADEPSVPTSVGSDRCGDAVIYEKGGKTFSMKLGKLVSKIAQEEFAEANPEPDSGASNVSTNEPSSNGGCDLDQEPPAEAEPEPPAVVLDCLRSPVPENLLPIFDAGLGKFANCQKLIRELYKELRELAAMPAGIEWGSQGMSPRTNDRPPIQQDLDMLRHKLEIYAPYTVVCPKCLVDPAPGKQQCPSCRGRGWVTKQVFDRCEKSVQESARRHAAMLLAREGGAVA